MYLRQEPLQSQLRSLRVYIEAQNLQDFKTNIASSPVSSCRQLCIVVLHAHPVANVFVGAIHSRSLGNFNVQRQSRHNCCVNP